MRRTRLSWIVSIAALFLLALGATAAQANVGGFAGGDGTETAGDCSTVLDWSCLAPSQYVATLDPSGSDDVTFLSGHEDNIDQWSFTSGSSATSKADVQGVWSYSSTNAAHDTNYLDMAFNRGAGTGDSYIAFELNQNGAKYTNSVGSSIACRTNGDVIVSFQVSPSSTTSINMYKWMWNAGPPPCTPGASGSWSAPVTLAASDAELAINSGQITNYLESASIGSSFASGTFGEAA